VLWNTGNFTFSPVQVASAPYGALGTPVDVNQDGYTDLLVSEYACQGYQGCTSWEVLLGSASKTFKQSASVSMGSVLQGFWGTTAADVNGDGINDVVGISYITNGTKRQELVVWLGNPDGSYQNTPLEYFIGSMSNALALVASDYNRDGKVDFAIADSSQTGSSGVGVLLNATPRGTCTPSTESPAVTVCQPQNLAYLNSPVDWVADSYDSSHSVTAMQVYVDGKLVVNSPSASINQPLTLTGGPHSVVTKGWDSSGANFQSDRSVTIYSGSPGETCPASPATINVCLPTQNETTTTSLHVFANADSSANQITAVQVYIDNSLIYNDTSGATYVDTAFTVTKGSHVVVVKAFDQSGNIYSETRNVTAN
jgi:hypothetical protein